MKVAVLGQNESEDTQGLQEVLEVGVRGQKGEG